MNVKLLLQQQGLSVRQLAAELEVPLKTVQDWVYRARGPFSGKPAVCILWLPKRLPAKSPCVGNSTGLSFDTSMSYHAWRLKTSLQDRTNKF